MREPHQLDSRELVGLSCGTDGLATALFLVQRERSFGDRVVRVRVVGEHRRGDHHGPLADGALRVVGDLRSVDVDAGAAKLKGAAVGDDHVLPFRLIGR